MASPQQNIPILIKQGTNDIILVNHVAPDSRGKTRGITCLNGVP